MTLDESMWLFLAKGIAEFICPRPVLSFWLSG